MVDASEKDKVLESGGKVACIVSQVLFFEQVRALRKSPKWCVFSSYLKMSCAYAKCCYVPLSYHFLFTYATI